jgi:hypothetical protein
MVLGRYKRTAIRSYQYSPYFERNHYGFEIAAPQVGNGETGNQLITDNRISSFTQRER